MFILKDEKQIENAVQKARRVKPKVRVLEFGKYLVGSSRGGSYVVQCKRNRSGEKVISCACETKDGVPCYHAAAAIGIHIVLAEQWLAKPMADRLREWDRRVVNKIGAY